MRLTKIDLRNLVAVGHQDGQLGLLIDRGDEIEYLEIPAPEAAYQGLTQVADFANDNLPKLTPTVNRRLQLTGAQPIAMLPVNSSMANAVGYDPSQQVLQVEYSNGSVYEYSDIDTETWESLQTTDSIGRFINQNIKGQYQSKRIKNRE